MLEPPSLQVQLVYSEICPGIQSTFIADVVVVFVANFIQSPTQLLIQANSVVVVLHVEWQVLFLEISSRVLFGYVKAVGLVSLGGGKTLILVCRNLGRWKLCLA